MGAAKFEELTNLTCTNTFKYVNNHEYYDQLDNNLLLITNKITPADITSCIKKATPIKLGEIAYIFKECTLNFDRIISLLSFLPKEQSELYKLRNNFIVIEDILTTYLKKKEELEDPNPFISAEKSGQIIHLIGVEIDRLSRKDRRIINRRLRNKRYIQFLMFLRTFIANKFHRRK